MPRNKRHDKTSSFENLLEKDVSVFINNKNLQVLCKMEKFSSEKIKEILAIHENTLMKFFIRSMKRLENKIERFGNANRH